MYCPNCRQEIKNGLVCPFCGANVVLLRKAANNSIRFYNEALEKANYGDLSGAVSALNKSLSYNKHNIIARNLLGLVYYETGQIGHALKHWVISGGLSKEDNASVEYINHSQKNQRAFERLNDSLKMYNSALVYLEQNSDDMAVIQLKKAIEINNKLLDAYNLLALCYMMQKNNDKAVPLLQKVLEMDAGNEKAKRYLQYINPQKNKHDNNFAKRPVQIPQAAALQVPYATAGRKNKRRQISGIGLYEIISFLAGGLIVGAVMYILIIPSQIDVREQKITSLENSFTRLKQNYEEQKIEDDEKIKQLEAENKNLLSNNTELEEQVETNAKVQKINTASNLYAQGSIEEAAAALFGMDISNLPQESLDNYNSLVEKAFPKVAQTAYTQGRARYDRGAYDEAIQLFEKSVRYAESVPVTKYTSMYYLGLICVSNDDKIKARQYFEEVLANHPTASMKNYAKNQLNKING